MWCVRCNGALWPGEQELCPSCAVAVRLEYRRGLRQLESYLRGWATFSAWLESTPRA